MTARHSGGDFAVKPTLTGERVVLRPFRDDDFPAIERALRDPEIIRLTGSTPLVWDETAERRLREWYGTRNRQTDRLDLAIADRATGEWAGEVVLNELDRRNAACNFRILVGPQRQDRGLGSEAMGLLLPYAFRQLHLHRVALSVYDFNPRARHVYEKAGFVAEGRLRHTLRTPDGWADTIVMAALSPDLHPPTPDPDPAALTPGRP